MYQEKPDHSYDWFMLILLVIIGLLLIAQQIAMFTSMSTLVRMR